MAKSIYAVQADYGGPIKIGFASDPAQRLRSMQSGCPVPLRIVGQWWYEDHFMVESLLHTRFKAARLHGEWFSTEDADVRDWLESGLSPGEWLAQQAG